MAQQTAVEWLLEQLTPSIALRQKWIDEFAEQAKAMEKEDREKTYSDGVNDARKNSIKYSYYNYNKSRNNNQDKVDPNFMHDWITKNNSMKQKTSIEVRYRDIDPDTGKATGVDVKVATCDDIHMARWIMKSLYLSLRESGEPNREIYSISNAEDTDWPIH